MSKINNILISMVGFGYILMLASMFFLPSIGYCNDKYYSNYYIYGDDLAYGMHSGCIQAMMPYLYISLYIMYIVCAFIYLPIIIWIIIFIYNLYKYLKEKYEAS